MHDPTRDLAIQSPLAFDSPRQGAAQAPHIEILSRPPGPPSVRTPLLRSARLRVFAAVFALVLAAGALWDFSRPPTYRASGILLVEVPEGVGFAAGATGVDAQNMAVQERVLLAAELLQGTLERAALETPAAAALDLDALKAMLAVAPTSGTNLVELTATGEDPRLLSVLVNAWISAYLGERRQRAQSDVEATLARLDEEYRRLGKEKESKRLALEDYRRRYDIDTMEQEGNQALARLRSLTESINKSRGDREKAQAKLAAFEEAIARGEPVVPQSEQGGIEQLENEAAKLRARLAELRKRYTPIYLEHEPSLRELPGQLDELESRIAAKRAAGRELLRSQLSREAAQALRQIQVQERQLAAARSEASRFTSRYAQYESLKVDLEKVAELHRELEGRIVAVKAKAPERYGQVEVVEPARTPGRPIAPDYWRDLLLVLGAAGASALLAVGLWELLTRRPREDEEMLPTTGVRVSLPGASGAGLATASLAAAPAPSALAGGYSGDLGQGAIASLPSAIQRELQVSEVQALTAIADPATRQLLGLLLAGLTPEECAGLEAADLDLESGSLRVPGDGRRVGLSPRLVAELAGHRPVPLWSGAPAAGGVERLAARLGLLAHDAGLVRPAEVGVGALRHTYIAWLARQGARLTELERLVGPLPAAELARYGTFSPRGGVRPMAEIDPLYPAFPDGGPSGQGEVLPRG